MKKINTLILLIITLSCNTIAQDRQFTKEQWIEDLEFAVKNLKSNHPHIYYKVTEHAFNEEVSIAKNSIATSKNDLEAFYAIKKVVAMIQDGHTQLFDRGSLGIESLRYPFRADQFSDGVFITVIDKQYERFLGAKILQIDGKSINEVLKKISQYVNIDNDFGKIRPNTQSLTFAKTLFGLGITNSDKNINIDLITREGDKEILQLKSREDKSPILWSNRINQAPTKGAFVNASTLLNKKTPLHIQLQEDSTVLFYWFEHLKEEKAIYFQYNQVWATQPNADETWKQFTKRIWQYIDEHDIEKLIIDVRYNDGGNGRTMIPFINEIIKRERFCNKKNLFVLSGNRTYSASVIFMTELAVHTNAIFIGTPPSSPFNFFSDMNIVGNLPNSNAGLGIASRQIDNAWSNQTVYFAPDIPAPMSSLDYFSGNDPALDIALNEFGVKTIADVAAEEGAKAAFKYYHQLKAKYAGIDWWTGFNPETFENIINAEGYTFLGKQESEQAFEIFKLNTLIFAESANVWDSFAEWHFNMKKYEQAVTYYKKSLELNPENTNAKNMIKQIENEK
ncbi:MAG: hypothetical protein JEZ09_09950 [Salinivirgaceae bacterium]|nr:hypothetical protein [Salinivirgaceae bacterium]